MQPEAIARLESRSRINNVIELAREQLLVRDDEIDSDGHRFGLKDGSVYDLREGRICDDLNSIVTMRVDAVYDAEADCPHWKQFVERIFDGDEELISFARRAVGYSLSGDTSAQCMFVLVGSGSNGKSTFINTIADMLGEYSAATPMKTLMFRQYGNDQTDDLARLVRKRFVSASEGEDGQKLAQAKIKNMTGGEKLSCRALWQNLFEYRPEFKLWLATNSLPDINGADEAVRRRIHIIDFPVKFTGADRDMQLPQKLTAEKSGILNWAIDGYMEWQCDGLNPPERVHGSTTQYLQDNDPVGQFIETCCVRAPLAVGTSKDLHHRYCQWAEASGYEPMHVNTFGKTLAKKGFGRRNKRTGTAWKGLDLKPDAGE
jgi:putative DNA primase/helicase